MTNDVHTYDYPTLHPQIINLFHQTSCLGNGDDETLIMVDVLKIEDAIFSVNDSFFDCALNIGSLSNSTLKALLSTWGIKRAHPALRAPLSMRGMKRAHPVTLRVPPLCTRGMKRAHPVTLRVPPLYTRGIIILLTNFCMFVHETTHHAFATTSIT